MPITMELCENDRVLYYRITDPWKMGDLIPLYQQNNAIRDDHAYRIHTVVNLLELHSLPRDVISVRRLSPDVKHPRAGHVFLICTSSYVRMIAEVVIRILNSNKIQFVNNEEAAWGAVRALINSETDVSK